MRRRARLRICGHCFHAVNRSTNKRIPEYSGITLQTWPAEQLSQLPLSLCEQLAQLFHQTVHQINCRDYGPEQIAAWSPRAQSAEAWQSRLQSKQALYIAKAGNQMLGFVELDPPDSARRSHIDCLYVHHRHQRQGVGAALISVLETDAKAQGISLLYVEASITAQPFFSHHGFRVVREQIRDLRGCQFKQFYMEKPL